jgi:hypothetical protein
MYLARFPLQSLVKAGRIHRSTQHGVFAGCIVAALAHGSWVLSTESSM